MQTAPPTPRPEPSQTTGEMFWEVADLTGGAAVMLLPLLLLAVPGIAAFVVLPAIVLLAVAAAPAIVAGAVVVPAYLLVRAVRRSPRHVLRGGAPHGHVRTARARRRQRSR
jgi:membrane protein implicated in regulation of membrane protease activity